MIGQLLYGILWVVSIIVAAGFAKWWKDAKDDERVSRTLSELQEWAEIAVRYAKDIGEQEDLTGDNRRKAAINVLTQIRDRYDIDISDDQIVMLVRSAYTVMASEDAQSDLYRGLEVETEVTIEDEEEEPEEAQERVEEA